MKTQILLVLFTVIVFANETHHPSSVLYDESKSGFKSLNSPLLGDWKDAKVVGDLLENGKVVCGSCHVSNSTKYTSPDETRELRTSNQFSTLCLSCHDK
jgi:hypothetical protein